MYTIVKLKTGKFLGPFRLQDGTGRYTFDTPDEAVKSAKRFAETVNGARGEHGLKKKHITFLQEKDVVETRWVPRNPT